MRAHRRLWVFGIVAGGLLAGRASLAYGDACPLQVDTAIGNPGPGEELRVLALFGGDLYAAGPSGVWR
ncbi:MAG: hypothetical protein J7M39_05065 [Anaerolineae bacterium]|nr:hypothetical protein [Anaerolineae bacterium]